MELRSERVDGTIVHSVKVISSLAAYSLHDQTRKPKLLPSLPNGNKRRQISLHSFFHLHQLVTFRFSIANHFTTAMPQQKKLYTQRTMASNFFAQSGPVELVVHTMSLCESPSDL